MRNKVTSPEGKTIIVTDVNGGLIVDCNFILTWEEKYCDAIEACFGKDFRQIVFDRENETLFAVIKVGQKSKSDSIENICRLFEENIK